MNWNPISNISAYPLRNISEDICISLQSNSMIKPATINKLYGNETGPLHFIKSRSRETMLNVEMECISNAQY